MGETIDARMGLDEASWREVNLYEITHPVVFQSICRALVGAPLCDDDEFLDAFHTFSTGVGAGAVIIGQYLPSLITPLIGFLFSIPVSVYRKSVEISSASGPQEHLMKRALTAFSDAPPLPIANDLLTMVS